MKQRVEKTFAGRKLVIETGGMAKQAAGSAMVQFGETMVLAAVTVSENQSPLPFFPLTVEYRERQYAAGKIPGGFIKREGRPSDSEILSARIVDRSIRPLFPEGFKNEVQVFVYVISADQENDADVLALVATSYALNASKIPFSSPIAGVRVGRIQGKWYLNPTFQQLEYSDMELVVAGSNDSIVMVEGGALEVSEDDIVEALGVAQKGIRELIASQEELLSKAQRTPKMAWEKATLPEGLEVRVKELAEGRISEALNQKDKHTRIEAIERVKREVADELLGDFPDAAKELHTLVGDVEYHQLRNQVLSSGHRVDGRTPKEIRPISVEAGLLPRAHGSSLFTRGQTQALVVATLGTQNDVQRLDSIDEPQEVTKSFMLHYNFPPFSTGEVRPVRGTSRREIGHGNLAERALQGVLPAFEEFPYTVRVVSDVLESNGSSSMASVCGGSLALFDAGVPMRGAVAGVAMGLIKEASKTAILSDIAGLEDHEGDMDFKVAGTRKGITALQMDIKVSGISREVMAQALQQAKEGRLFILDKMDAALAKPKAELSEFAPRLYTIFIPKDRIRDVIGSGGKTIRWIVEETGTKIDVEDDGKVTVASTDGASAQRAIDIIKGLTASPEVGKNYKGTVKRIEPYGAFVEILPGQDGLLHISEMAHTRVGQVTDLFQLGDEVEVQVVGIEPETGKIRLSRKPLLPPPTEEELAAARERAAREPRGDRG